jgi:hypothetical protein
VRNYSGYPVLVPNKTIEAPGNFYWPMGNAAVNRYAYRGAAYQHARTDTAVVLEVGDTVTFTYDSEGGLAAVSYFLHSSSSAENVGYAGHDANGDLILSNFTATMDGDPIAAGDPIYNSNITTDMKFHTISLTATARTDFRHIGSMGDGDLGASGNPGTGIIIFALFDFFVVTASQTYSWPMHTYNNALQAEANGTGNNVTINNHMQIRWITVDIEENQGTGVDWDLRTSDPNSGDNLSSRQPSLRTDGTGYSLGFLAGAEYMRALSEGWTTAGDLPYEDGFTIEVLCRYKGSANSDSRACGIVNSFNNTAASSLWLIGFDNFDDATNANSVRPCFTILGRSTIYADFNNYSTIEAEVRDSTDAVVDKIYHLVGTIKPSNDTIEFWVNGVSIGTAVIDPAWYGSLGSDSVLDGSRSTVLHVGPRFLNGAWRIDQLSEIQDVKIHLLEANQAFVDRQYGSSSGLIAKSLFHPDHEEVGVGGVSPIYSDGEVVHGYRTVLVEGNSTAVAMVRAGQARNAGKYYLEFEINAISATSLNSDVGLWDLNDVGGRYLRIVTSGGAYFSTLNSTGVWGASLTFNAGDIIGIAIDFDSGDVDVYENNVLSFSVALGTDMYSGLSMVPMVRVNAAHTGTLNVTCAFQASLLTYAPPAGYSAWIGSDADADLLDSSGITPGAVDGLHAGTTITARHPAGDTRVFNKGTTRNTDQEAERVGTELYQQDSWGYPFNLVTGQCTMYTEDVIAPGEKKYVEFVFDVSSYADIRYGTQVEGHEHPGILLGSLTNDMGFTNGGSRDTVNPLRNLVSLKFSIGDIISLAIDYSVTDEATYWVYINGKKVDEYTKSFSSLASGNGLRPCINLARGSNTDYYGDTARILTHQGVQTYAPPATFTALEI